MQWCHKYIGVTQLTNDNNLNVTVVINRSGTGTIWLPLKRFFRERKRIECCFGIQRFHASAFVSAARLWELHPSGAAVQPDSSVHVRQRSVQSRLCVRQPGPQTRGRAPCVDGATRLNTHTCDGIYTMLWETGDWTRTRKCPSVSCRLQNTVVLL